MNLLALASAAYMAALAGADRAFDPKAYGPPLSYDSRWTVIGRTNTGKDFWVACAVEKAQRVVMFDRGRDPKWLRIGYQPTTVGRLLSDPQGTGQLMAAPQLHLVVTPSPSDFRKSEDNPRPELEQAEELGKLAQLCRGAENLVLIIGEAGLLPSTCDDVLAEIAMADRHHGIALITISQRAVGVPPNVRSQATQIVSFEQSDVSDLKALADKCGEDFAQQCRNWKPKQPPAIWRPHAREGKRG